MKLNPKVKYALGFVGFVAALVVVVFVACTITFLACAK
jgi:hypothetical protein